jgi:DNA-binding response OmpR family regulator
MRILILEDDQIFGETLELFLTKKGYKIDLVTTIEEAEEITFDNRFDLYLFDINLPDGKGLDLLNALRFAEDETPTIFITALTDLNSMAEGFRLGAVDYIKKPFVPKELLIRIEAKFREKSIRYGDILYNPSTKIIMKNKEPLDIGRVPTQIFAKLLERMGQIVLKEELLEVLEQPSNNALRVNITKIKQRLSIEIKNIRSRGYILKEI